MSSKSEYDPIWSKLKTDKVVKVTANRLLHPRIVKAVKKRKWLDIAYKLETDPVVETLSHSIDGSVIIFRLSPSDVTEKFIL